MVEAISNPSYETSPHSKKQIVVLVGPEGAGKSVQAKLLAEKLGVPKITTGDIVRERAKNDKSEVGDACRSALSGHGYVNPDILVRMIEDRIRQEDTENGFILDGGMRTIEETEQFSSSLKRAGRDNLDIALVYLRLPGWKSFERLTGDSGRNRSDDTISGVTGRLSNFYNGLGIRMSIARNISTYVPIIEGSKSVNQIHEEIVEKLQK